MVLQAYNQVRTGFSLCRAGECKQSVPASETELRERELRLWQILTPTGQPLAHNCSLLEKALCLTTSSELCSWMQ